MRRKNSHRPISPAPPECAGKFCQEPPRASLSASLPPVPLLAVLLTVLFNLGLAAQTNKDFEGWKTLSSPMNQARTPRNERGEDENPRKSVLGQVVDMEGRGLARAVVHLKNNSNQEVKTHISDAQGNFHFRDLNPKADYEVHAQLQESSSSKRSVSSFDGSKETYLVLRIDTSE